MGRLYKVKNKDFSKTLARAQKMAAPNPPPVVIDNGSWTIKAGFSADRSPRIEIPSVVGREGGNLYVGEDIKGHPSAILESVISRGKVGDWDAMVEVRICT